MILLLHCSGVWGCGVPLLPHGELPSCGARIMAGPRLPVGRRDFDRYLPTIAVTTIGTIEPCVWIGYCCGCTPTLDPSRSRPFRREAIICGYPRAILGSYVGFRAIGVMGSPERRRIGPDIGLYCGHPGCVAFFRSSRRVVTGAQGVIDSPEGYLACQHFAYISCCSSPVSSPGSLGPGLLHPSFTSPSPSIIDPGRRIDTQTTQHNPPSKTRR
jgi:hypothetical protein